MNRLEKIKKLNKILLLEMPEYKCSASGFSDNISEQRRLLRSLMNVREPRRIDPDFVKLQDELLSEEREEKGIVNIAEIPFAEPNIKLWRGDITRLNADAVVNAANSALLGCFCPCHGCIDNAIHSAAGLQLREECAEIMRALSASRKMPQGYFEPMGMAKITRAYNLPSKYVIHTVGPIVRGEPAESDCELLRSCYNSCLNSALEHGLSSIAFCCISTGEFHFPNKKAAEIAVNTVREFIKSSNKIEVIFNVFKEQDELIYRELLG